MLNGTGVAWRLGILISFGCPGYFLGQSSRVESPQLGGDYALPGQIGFEVVKGSKLYRLHINHNLFECFSSNGMTSLHSQPP